MNIKPSKILTIILIVSIITTGIHFTDNFLSFERYPQPNWITPFGIIRSWLIWTVFGVLGHCLYTKQRFWIAYTCLLIYSTCGLSSLAHYLYGHIDEFSFKMHLLILADGTAGSMILGFIVWSILILKKPFTHLSTRA
jgi:hypothetical protein